MSGREKTLKGYIAVRDSEGNVAHLKASQDWVDDFLLQTELVYGPDWTWESLDREQKQYDDELKINAIAEKVSERLTGARGVERIPRQQDRIAESVATTTKQAAKKKKKYTKAEEECARRRGGWMDGRHPGWSIVRWGQHARADYKTLRKYRQGITTTQTPGLRAELARVEHVDFKDVPE